MPREGESLFYPWRVRSPTRHARRIDGVLATSIRRLASGEDEEEVLATLRLHVDGELRGEAGRWYDLAVDSLEEAAGRDWVFDADRRERALWITRAEYQAWMAALVLSASLLTIGRCQRPVRGRETGDGG